MTGGRSIAGEIAIIWKSLDLTDKKSTPVQVMVWHRQATRHYLKQSWPSSMSPYGVNVEAWTKWVTFCKRYLQMHFLGRKCAYLNSLWPSDAIWRQRSGSTLAHVMACCLTAPSHYLNQCWLIISKAEWHSSKGKFTRDHSAVNHWNYMEN